MTTPYQPSRGLRGKLERRWTRLAARAPLNLALDRAIVSFTFDDFPASAAQAGADALEAAGVRGTYYVCADFEGGENHHGPLWRDEDLARLRERGHDLACHTAAHLDIAKTSLEATQTDIARNAAAFAERGVTFRSFAFPFGEATPAAKRALGRRFRTLRGVQSGVNRGFADRALLRSTLIGPETGVETPAAAWLEDVLARPGWLIFFTHDVQSSPTRWGCKADTLKRLIERAQSGGAEILTVDAACDRLGIAAP
ncbi:MAG: polysaccharide deacetylase family protein [Maricaulaceae bacterium]